MLERVMQGNDVLVHCQMGRQRSAATVAAFLVTGGMTADAAIAHVRTKKREAFFPAANFRQALDSFEQRRLARCPR